MASADWPEDLQKLQELCESLSSLKKAATDLYEATLKRFNHAYAACHAPQTGMRILADLTAVRRGDLC